MKLIDKDALVAEIERLACQEYNSLCEKLLDYIDTLEVKEVEVDLDINFGICWGKYCDCGGNINDYEVAKHFFELGLKAQKVDIVMDE